VSLGKGERNSLRMGDRVRIKAIDSSEASKPYEGHHAKVIMTPTSPPASRALYMVQLQSGQELRLEQDALEPENRCSKAA
jgi:hypothetical protein